MTRFLSILMGVFSICMLNAQENLYPLQQNKLLYLETLPYQNVAKADLIDQNIVITSDTLSLPFIDDFAKNTLRPFDFEMTNITSTVDFANGSCVINSDFDFEEKGFHFATTYTYSYDTITDLLDSVATTPITINTYESATCFPTPSSTASYWLPTFVSTVADFDTITGEKLDSFLVDVDTLIDVATIHFANLDPTSQWIDNYAYWNTTYPILPPTIGIATLDGLNQFGLPYNNDFQNAYGDADLLTSKPIDLFGLSNDSAVYLSFFYQMQGLGDVPNSEDSLVVEFRNEFDGTWKTAWSLSADDASTDFTQVYVEIRDTNLVQGPHYFYSEFQFRFRNKASLSGNNDHWHIDYVRLDKNRDPLSNDTIIRDVALLYNVPNYLSNYSTLPWRQLQAGADSFASQLSIPIRDNGQVEGLAAGAFPIDFTIDNTFNSDIIYQLTGLNFNPTQEVKIQDFDPATDFTLPVFSSDSVCLRSSLFISPVDRNTLTINDTISSEICFEDIMAYDDGSAERAYGLEGGTTEDVKKFAYEFEVAQEDTLAAIQVHFSNIDENVENLIFSFFVWDSIGLGSALPYDNEIATIENQKPIYVDMHNGFATFAFDSGIVVNDNFYVGWAQTDDRNLQIGYDLNSTKGHEHMFVQVNNQWAQSSIQTEGSPMMRVVLDGGYPFMPTPIREVVSPTLVNVYPNPTNGLLSIDLPSTLTDFEVAVFDYAGRTLYTAQNQATIAVNSLQNGTYLIKIVDRDTKSSYYSRFIKID